MARARLRRIETDLLGYFKSMGASAWGLDAKERLEVMHSIFHPDGEPFSFDWKWLAPSGLSTKDLSPRPRSASAMPGCLGWAANTGR